ncbi:hypothetical protein [Enterococcus sp. 5H]|uniref:hypothetical protein n=1 Tax=Enterococcus sp. 5H TaxID=1229490 RepID=UPI0023027585|nr:hypothetical protein [Enterococcus sp. 5H]MDA9471068.1 hypothetical protein [Enterococcus sp. 5H]
MSEMVNKPQKQGKKILKKYILHQKVNPKLLGVELFNNNLMTPYEAFLSCKLIFKEDIQTLANLEKIVNKVQEVWSKKNNVVHIKKINVFTAPAYIVLTFTLGFFEQEQAVYLRDLKQCAKELIEGYDHIVSQEQAAENKRKEREIYDVLERCNLLTEKLEGLEGRLIKNESIVLDSGELIKIELDKVSKTIKEQMKQTEQGIKNIQEYEPVQERNKVKLNEKKATIGSNHLPKKKINKTRKYLFNRTQQTALSINVKDWISASTQLSLKKITTKKTSQRIVAHENTSVLEIEILKCFTEAKDVHKKRMIPRKQFLELKTRVEFIDYLWMLIELEGKDEIIIAEKLSCRQLVEDLGQFLENVEAVISGPAILNYWVYCSEELLIKLNGYVALKNFLSRSLQLQF